MCNSPIYAYGLGFYLFDYRGEKALVGGGQIQGMNAAFMALPERNIAVSVMVNTYQTMGYLTLNLMLLDAMLGYDDRDWQRDGIALAHQFEAQTMAQVQPIVDARQDKPMSLQLEAYTGIYHNQLAGAISISMTDVGLTLVYGSGYAGTLTHWDGDTFVFTMTAPTIADKDLMQFEVSSGQVKALVLRSGMRIEYQHGR